MNAKLDENREKSVLLVDESTGELFPWACDPTTGEGLIEVYLEASTPTSGSRQKIDANRVRTPFMVEAQTNPIQAGMPIGLLLGLTYATDIANTDSQNIYPLICDSNGYLKIDLQLT